MVWNTLLLILLELWRRDNWNRQLYNTHLHIPTGLRGHPNSDRYHGPNIHFPADNRRRRKISNRQPRSRIPIRGSRPAARSRLNRTLLGDEASRQTPLTNEGPFELSFLSCPLAEYCS